MVTVTLADVTMATVTMTTVSMITIITICCFSQILQKSLSLLFTTYDVSQVKSYVQRQASKLLDGHVAVQDYILAKEYRGRGNYRLGACVPSLELARRATELDPRAEPRPGERVPYVVVYGHPGQPLIQVRNAYHSGHSE